MAKVRKKLSFQQEAASSRREVRQILKRLTSRILPVPHNFRIVRHSENYTKADCQSTLNAWGIKKIESVWILPEGWKYENIAHIIMVSDENNHARLHVDLVARKVFAHSAVTMYRDWDRPHFVVKHLGNPVFKTDEFKIDLRYKKTYGPAGEECLAKAQAFIQENFPLLESDPNAYWK